MSSLLIKEIMRLALIFILLVCVQGAYAAGFTADGLLEQARTQCPERAQYAREQHARVELTADKKSFYVLWFPEETDPENPPPMIVTIHGHASWAFDEFYLWHQAARERGYGILAIQWWLGEGEEFTDYLSPQEIYRVIDNVLSRERVKRGTVLFHGFSRGSANSYGVAALDRVTGTGYFALIVANAGKPGLDFPPNRDIVNGRYGDTPLRGTHWVTFAGGRDPHPDRDGIFGMREAADWIRKYGGVVDRVIEDTNADHGGFHRNPENMRAALDVFAQRLAETGVISP